MSQLNPRRFSIAKAVFFPALILLFGAILMVLTIPEKGSNPFAGLQALIVDTASWFYVLIVTLIAVIVVYLALSRYGDIKLGPDHAEPAYSYISWFAMLFSAGIGIGMMFYGIAEPVMHFLAPPTGPGGTPAAATEAIQISYFHWGFNAWAIYAIVALILAYFAAPDIALSFLPVNWRAHSWTDWCIGGRVRSHLHDLRHLGEPRPRGVANQHRV